MRRMSTFALPSIFMVLCLAFDSKQNPADNPKALVEMVVAEVGGINRFYSLKDVEYTYTYHDIRQKTKEMFAWKDIFLIVSFRG